MKILQKYEACPVKAFAEELGVLKTTGRDNVLGCGCMLIRMLSLLGGRVNEYDHREIEIFLIFFFTFPIGDLGQFCVLEKQCCPSPAPFYEGLSHEGNSMASYLPPIILVNDCFS